jgi:predicted DNA-binding protein (MmcQ/YjbR family)
MTPQAVEKTALALTGATRQIQWGDHIVFKVGGKMFAILSGPDARPRTLSFKCSDLAFEMLAERDGIIPAPYMARAKWVRLETLRAMPDGELKARLAEAHRLVALGLPKKTQVALGLR